MSNEQCVETFWEVRRYTLYNYDEKMRKNEFSRRCGAYTVWLPKKALDAVFPS
jgi:hypothetical protein